MRTPEWPYGRVIVILWSAIQGSRRVCGLAWEDEPSGGCTTRLACMVYIELIVPLLTGQLVSTNKGLTAICK